jgi:hypothetical protein
VRARAVVWIELAGKQRPGVVIEVRNDMIRVAYGTSQEAGWPFVAVAVVHPETRQGRAFPLREPTHFYGANTCWEQPRNLRATNALCAWELYYEIRNAVEQFDAASSDP